MSRTSPPPARPDLKNALAQDVLAPSLTPEQALANAPKQDNNLFVVPRMIEG